MANIVVVETSKPLDGTCQALERAITDHGFGILHIHNVRQTLASKGVQFDREVRIYDVCNPHRAKEVLEQNPLMSAALPCAISVFAEGARTKVAFIRPTVMLGLFGAAGLEAVAEEVERTVKQIVDAAVR